MKVRTGSVFILSGKDGFDVGAGLRQGIGKGQGCNGPGNSTDYRPLSGRITLSRRQRGRRRHDPSRYRILWATGREALPWAA